MRKGEIDVKKNLIAKLVLVSFLVIACSHFFSGDASAMLINYITSGDGLDPSVVPVDLTFIVDDSVLTASLTNLSDFTITQFGFNASSAVTGLTVNDFPTGWSLQTNYYMGPYDFEFGGKAKIHDGVDPGASQNFVFNILGTGSYTPIDFWVEGTGPTAGIKVQGGPGDLSGYVATPEPGTLLLLGVGLTAVGLFGRRRLRANS